MSSSPNPFQVLGVVPAATRDEIEGAYRRQLRVHHPDLHHGGTPEEIEAAESATRRLNEAMALVRGGWSGDRSGAAGGEGEADGDGRWDSAFRYDEDTDWFGNPVKGMRAPPVECPLCGTWFDDPAVYRSHLRHEHQLGDEATATEPRPRRQWLRWLAWIPAPTLTLCATLAIYWAVVIALLPKPLSFVFIWLGVVAFGLLLSRAIKGRRQWW